MKPIGRIYENDKKAPRMGSKKFSKMVVTKDLWKRFIRNNEDYKEMTWKEFYRNWMDIAETIRNEAIYNPLGVKLEKFVGELKFQYLPHKFKSTDLATSTEMGEKVSFLNINGKGKVGKIKWERRWAVKFNKMLQFYAFDEVRELNRMAKIRADDSPNDIRVARNTLGGHSVWRQKR